jgi:epsilon-lactone hydrolase
MASEELKVVNELLAGMDLGGLTLQERRAFMESLSSWPQEGAAVDRVDAKGVPGQWIGAAGVTADRVILYFHGGGYQLRSPGPLRAALERICDVAQARVLSVLYRLAPENPFPAAVDDALTAYRWLLAQGTDARRIALAGDSAGGGLTLATLVALRDAGEPMPAAAVAISPWTDLAGTGESVRTRAAVDVVLTPAGLREAADWYLAGQDPSHPYASPVHADLRGLPPILIHVGDAEILLDDSTRFAAAASAAGVDVTLEVWDCMPHVWHAFTGLLPEADQAIERIGSWLRERTPAG